MTSTLSNTSFVPTNNPPIAGNAMQKTSSHNKAPTSTTSAGVKADGDKNATLITKLRDNDVLLGRGGGTNNHAGNVKFRKLINEHKLRYLAASKVDKPKVAREVVQIWRSMQPPGRFLARHDEDSSEKSGSNAEDNQVWVDVGDKKANAKASQCLRERTPEVMPYIRQLREHQDLTTEQGVMMMGRHQQGSTAMSSAASGGTPPAYPVDPFAQHSPGAGGTSFDPMAHGSSPAAMMSSPGGADGRYSANVMSPHHMSPMGRGVPGVQAAYSPHAGSYASPSQVSPRRPGLPMAPAGFRGGTAPIPPGPPPIATADPGMMDPMDPSVAAYYGDMSDREYEQSMMIMQQQLEMQHMQLRRMQQQRAMQRTALGSSSGISHQHHHQQQNNGAASMRNMGAQEAGTPREAPDTNARKPKRTLSMTKPERTNSDLSALRIDGNHDLPTTAEADGELTLEEYRQQLEAYITNTQNDDEEDDGHASDLEDDWEKERDKHMNSDFARRTPSRGVSRTRSRGVDRAKSGASFMSIGTRLSGTGMSVVSGFSNLSDLMSAAGEDEQQRKVDRTMSNQSNLSIMSELTDLSANIDNLSLYED